MEIIGQTFEPTCSVWSCEICEIIAKDKDPKPDETGTTYSIMNPVVCPYKYVKIKGKIYRRKIFVFDNTIKEDLIKAWNVDKSFDFNIIRCHDCGVPYGYIHHIGCDCEDCPICDLELPKEYSRQFISCDHSFDRKLTDFKKEM